jgi:hypothetical protein
MKLEYEIRKERNTGIYPPIDEVYVVIGEKKIYFTSRRNGEPKINTGLVTIMYDVLGLKKSVTISEAKKMYPELTEIEEKTGKLVEILVGTPVTGEDEHILA